MERAFYTGRLKERFGIGTVVPGSDQRDEVHRVIYKELCRGVIDDGSRRTYLGVMDELVKDGAQAIVLGCTEIGLLVKESDTRIPLYDTARLHAEAAVEWMMEKGSA